MPDNEGFDDALLGNEPPVDDAAPDPLAEAMKALEGEHADVFDELAEVDPPVAADGDALKIDHDAVLSELSESLGDESPTAAPTEEAAALPLGPETANPAMRSPGRYYVPPSKRRPANRAQRRAEAQESQQGPPPTYAEYMAQGGVPMGPADSLEDSGLPGGSGMQAALDADFSHRKATTDFLVEHTRKVEELTRRLEQERL